VFLSAPAAAEPQDYLCASTSSGFAAGVDVAHAARAATIELIERDAFVITWLNRLPVREIDLERAEGVTKEIIRTFGRWGTKLRAFLLPTDLPAVPIMTIALDETGAGPAAMIALGCAMHPRRSLEKAIFEICQVHEPLQKAHRDGRGEGANTYGDVRTLEQHAAYFFRRDHLHELDFLLERSASISIDEVQGHGGPAVDDDLRTLAGAFRAIGSRLLYRDVTTPDLSGYPIRVVRALAPHIQPIHFGHGQERLGGRRLYELPAQLGQSDGPRLEASLNPCPHPLA
jgi:ribosomal protein S12 methylthiotransferase accessory factor